MIGEIHAFEKQKISTISRILIDEFLFVIQQTHNKKIENSVSDIINVKKNDFPTDTDHISLPNSAEKLKQ